MTFMFGLVVYGNLTDNFSQPKFILVYSQAFLAICWILTGVLVHVSTGHYS